MKNNYQPIQTPFSTRLREFRHRILPVIIFLCVGLIVINLWENNISEPGFAGKVVADSAYVNSPVTGIIEQLNAREFEYVNEGDPLAVIQVADSSYLQSRLEVIRAQIDFIYASMQPATDTQRNLMDLEGLKLEKSMLESELSSLKIRTEFAVNDFQKAEALFEDGMISELEFSDRQTQYLALKNEVETKEDILSELEESIRNLESSFPSVQGENAIESSVQVQNSMLREILEEMKPVVLRSPISGVVSSVLKTTGEITNPADPIIKIESADPNYIVGYVRQPLSVIPEEGMQVEIRARNPGRARYTSEILAVGGHILPIEPAMQRPGAIYESGLPVKIALSDDVEYSFVPGEIVDLVLKESD